LDPSGFGVTSLRSSPWPYFRLAWMAPRSAESLPARSPLPSVVKTRPTFDSWTPPVPSALPEVDDGLWDTSTPMMIAAMPATAPPSSNCRLLQPLARCRTGGRRSGGGMVIGGCPVAGAGPSAETAFCGPLGRAASGAWGTACGCLIVLPSSAGGASSAAGGGPGSTGAGTWIGAEPWSLSTAASAAAAAAATVRLSSWARRSSACLAASASPACRPPRRRASSWTAPARIPASGWSITSCSSRGSGAGVVTGRLRRAR
jgi:hypothetical protein